LIKADSSIDLNDIVGVIAVDGIRTLLWRAERIFAKLRLVGNSPIYCRHWHWWRHAAV